MSVRHAPVVRGVHASELVQVQGGEPFEVAVVADTHSSPHPNAGALLRDLAPGLILHAGDIGNLAVLDSLSAIAPLLAIRGNIDVHAPNLPDTLDITFASGERRLMRLLLIHIAVYGPRLRAEVVRLATARDARLVVCGHSHVPFIGKDKGLAVFNPGSIGPRRFQLPITFGVIRLASTGISLRHISCETGETWEP